MMNHAPAGIVGTYLGHINAHQLDAAMSCLSEEFHLEFVGSDFKLSKASARQALDWDVGTNGRVDWTVDHATMDEVRIVGHETNDFLQLVGIGQLPFRSHFHVRDGLIERQLHDVDWGDVSVDEALKPAIDWATIHDPEELADIYPEGRLKYNRESGQRWVALLRRWRKGPG